MTCWGAETRGHGRRGAPPHFPTPCLRPGLADFAELALSWDPLADFAELIAALAVGIHSRPCVWERLAILAPSPPHLTTRMPISLRNRIPLGSRVAGTVILSGLTPSPAVEVKNGMQAL